MIGNQKYEVTGEFRLEHQWWVINTTAVKVNWRWSVFQLNNSYEGSMLLLDVNGVPQRDSYLYLIDPSSEIHLYDIDTFQAVYSDPWISPQTNNTYYQTLHVVSPQAELDITLHTLIANNEYSVFGFAEFYEGMSLLSGTHMGRPVVGQGTIEMEPCLYT